MEKNSDNISMHLTEYNEAVTNLRHYSGLRFSSLTVFMAIMGVIIGVAFRVIETDESTGAILLAKYGGLVVTLVFLAWEIVILSSLSVFVKRAIFLEVNHLNFEIWRQRPKAVVALIRGTFVAFYVLVGFFWLFVLFFT